jgi:hypothetical protein
MNVQFFDRQDLRNPFNGLIIKHEFRLSELFVQLQGRVPFFCELLGENGCKILLGIGGQRGSVQYSRIDGAPPYLMAVSHDPVRLKKPMEFLMGGTPTPISSHYSISIDAVKEIAEHFRMTGEHSSMVLWEEI